MSEVSIKDRLVVAALGTGVVVQTMDLLLAGIAATEGLTRAQAVFNNLAVMQECGMATAVIVSYLIDINGGFGGGDSGQGA